MKIIKKIIVIIIIITIIIFFTENPILNQNKSLAQSKNETTTLFNPLVVSDKDLTNSQKCKFKLLCK